MKTPHAASAALLAVSLTASAYLLGRHHAPRFPNATVPASRPDSSAATSLVLPSPGTSLAHAHHALAAALVAGHWHPTPEWDALLRALSPSDLATLVPAVAALDRRSVRDPLLQALVTRWGECAPTVGLAWLARVPDKTRQSTLRAALVRGWAHAQPDALVTWLRTQPTTEPTLRETLQAALPALTNSRPSAALELLERHPEQRGAILNYHALFRAWAASDPPAAAARARSLPAGPRRTSALHAVIAGWSEHAPDAALAFARSLPAAPLVPTYGSFRCSLGADSELEMLGDTATATFTGSALSRLAERDPDAALAALRALPAGTERTTALRDLTRSLAPQDPSLAAVFVDALPPSPARSDLLREISRHYANHDASSALAWARTLPDTLARHSALQTIANTLSVTEPTRALEILESLPAGASRTHHLTQSAMLWAERDPALALAWARNRPDPTERAELLSTLAPFWARLDPSAALSYALSRETNPQRALLHQIGATLASEDPSTIARHAASLRDPAARRALLASAAETLAATSPQEAANLILQSSSLDFGYAVGDVARQLTAADPQHAVAWAAQLSSSDRSSAFHAIARAWAANDPQPASAWLATLPPGAARDHAIRGFVDTVASALPELAAATALAVSSPQARTAALERVAHIWFSRDRVAATAWLATAPLPEASRQQLLRR